MYPCTGIVKFSEEDFTLLSLDAHQSADAPSELASIPFDTERFNYWPPLYVISYGSGHTLVSLLLAWLPDSAEQPATTTAKNAIIRYFISYSFNQIKKHRQSQGLRHQTYQTVFFLFQKSICGSLLSATAPSSSTTSSGSRRCAI